MSKKWSFSKFLLVLALVTVSVIVSPVHAATFVVDTTADTADATLDGVCADASGYCSLRAAITEANATSGLDTITFNIGAGLQTITLGSGLPTISDPVSIYGPGVETDCASLPSALLIELNGNGVIGNGLSVGAGGGGSTISGLIINRFAGAPSSGSGIRVEGGGSSTITCNYIGTDSAGTADLGNANNGIYIYNSPTNTIAGNLISGNNFSGVLIQGGPATGNQVRGNYIGLQLNGTARLDNVNSGVRILGAPNNTVGGTTAAARNVISGNTNFGVSISGAPATGNTILGNYIGTQASGTAALGNTFSGISIDGAAGNVVGGTDAGTRNILSGNGFHGVILNNGASSNVVQGNYVGTGVNGTETIGNFYNGIEIRASSSGNRIGGSAAGEGNLITNNGGDGVLVDSGTGNLISGNRISANNGLGIDLSPNGVTSNDSGDGDSGANNLQNFPELTSASQAGPVLTIQGTLDTALALADFDLEFFYSLTADPSGNGEGAEFIGLATVTTDGSGDATFSESFSFSLPGGAIVSATATDPSDNTSEFSAVEFPTEVTLEGFDAYSRLGSIVLQWKTTREVDNLGFNLYRAEWEEGTRAQLNPTMIATQFPGSPTGATYTWQDDQVEPGVTYYYWLEDIDIHGTGTMHGPKSAVVANYWCYLPMVER